MYPLINVLNSNILDEKLDCLFWEIISHFKWPNRFVEDFLVLNKIGNNLYKGPRNTSYVYTYVFLEIMTSCASSLGKIICNYLSCSNIPFNLVFPKIGLILDCFLIQLCCASRQKWSLISHQSIGMNPSHKNDCFSYEVPKIVIIILQLAHLFQESLTVNHNKWIMLETHRWTQ